MNQKCCVQAAGGFYAARRDIAGIAFAKRGTMLPLENMPYRALVWLPARLMRHFDSHR